MSHEHEYQDVAAALTRAGWTPDDRFPQTLRKNTAFWAPTDDCGASLLGVDSWTAQFTYDVPVVVVVAACLAAAGQSSQRLAEVIPLRSIR